MTEETKQPNPIDNAQGRQIQIKATDEVLAGKYANAMQVLHTKEEFVLDFLNIVPPQGALVSRVIISPAHLKRVVAALAENFKKYEAQFGVVEAASEQKNEIGFKV